MDKLTWCKKKAIQLTEPNTNLQEAYQQKADESLETIQTTKSRDWQLTAAYYAMYHGLYSLMMRIGVKSENHRCTIEIARKHLINQLTEQDISLIEHAYNTRIESQYHVNNKIKEEDYEEIIRKAPEIVVKCKKAIITEQETTNIRQKLSRKTQHN